jgi:toxin ParE1/3/4
VRRPVVWARDALDDIKQQVEFIGCDNPAAATRVAERIRDAGTALGDMAIGRMGRLTDTYEKPVSRLPYVIIYALVLDQGRETVFILRVIHAARDWPPEAWPN